MRIGDWSSAVCSSDLGGTRLLWPGPQDRVLPAIAGLPRPEHRAVARASAGRGELGRSPSVHSGGCGRPPRTRCPIVQGATPGCFAVARLQPIGEEADTGAPGVAGEVSAGGSPLAMPAATCCSVRSPRAYGEAPPNALDLPQGSD